MTGHRAATYATTDALFAALRSAGVRDVVISPGSRSTALALTAALSNDLTTHIVLDERSAGFVGLGMSIVGECPVALVCTSGTATANYLPAVVEAGRSRVPLVVLTADRPPGYLERDAPQTIDQTELYGSHVRQFIGLDVAHMCDPTNVATRVLTALRAAAPPNAGPVHVNCPFTKPLEPEPGWRPTGDLGPVPPAHAADSSPLGTAQPETEQLEAFLRDHSRGVIVAGPRRASSDELEAVESTASAAGWPIVADPLSGFRMGNRIGVVTAGELLVRSRSFAERHTPDAVVRLGGTPTGNGVQGWLQSLNVPQLIVDPDRRWTAPGPELVLRDDPASLFSAVSANSSSGDWVTSWMVQEEKAVARRHAEFEAHPDTELAVARTVLDGEPSLLWVASSMPVRHVDVVLGVGLTMTIVANRGANGIDGTIASAVGAAMARSERVTVLLGDLAFLHDIGSLTTANELGVDLTIVVVDNRGAAIFAMLPVADQPGLPFERVFTTPHSSELVAVAAGFGVAADRVAAADLSDALARARTAPGVHVFVVDADPDAMFEAYERLVAA